MKSIENKLKSIESKLKSFLKLIDQKNVEGGQKKVRVIEYPQIVWGGAPHTNQRHTLIKKTVGIWILFGTASTNSKVEGTNMLNTTNDW